MTFRPALSFASAVVFALLAASCLDSEALVPPTVDEDPSIPALDVNGSRFHVERFGNPVRGRILFLHGGPGGDFRYGLPLLERYGGVALGDEWELVFWDQRSTGLSRRHSHPTLEEYRSDIIALADVVSPDEPVVLLGHSWGGAYAASMIDSHPDRVKGAVFLNSVAFSRALADSRPSPLSIDAKAEWFEDFLWSTEIVSPADHAMADYFFASLTRTPLPGFGNHYEAPGWRYGAAVYKYVNDVKSDYDYTRHLGVFDHPVLFVAGADDAILGEELTRVHAGFFPDATVHVIQGAGHDDVLTIHADETVALVHAYLGGLP